MSRIIRITAILVGTMCILTRQWVYLAHIGAVLFAVTGWKPKWLALRVQAQTPGRSSSQAADAKNLRRWRSAALAFAAFAIVLLTDAYKRVIVEGAGSVWAAVATLMAAALVICGMDAQKKLENIERER